MITQETVRELLDYDPETGKLRWRPRGRHLFNITRDWEWKRWNTRYAGTEAGSINGDGYIGFSIFKKSFLAHQIIFLWMRGYLPIQIDHINHIRHDNRWLNLKESNYEQNSLNRSKRSDNSTGFVGVTKKRGKFSARVGFKGKRYDLGYFDTPEEAHYICLSKRKELGFHVNHGC